MALYYSSNTVNCDSEPACTIQNPGTEAAKKQPSFLCFAYTAVTCQNVYCGKGLDFKLYETIYCVGKALRGLLQEYMTVIS